MNAPASTARANIVAGIEVELSTPRSYNVLRHFGRSVCIDAEHMLGHRTLPVLSAPSTSDRGENRLCPGAISMPGSPPIAAPGLMRGWAAASRFQGVVLEEDAVAAR